MIVPCHEIMPVIFAALKRGQCVMITVNGNSMLPFIHDSDVVELEPILSLPMKGDIVLVKCTDVRYVMHRIILIKDNAIFLRGDAQIFHEGPFTSQNILGKVTMSIHNGHLRIQNRGIWRIAGLIWLRIFIITSCLKKFNQYTKFISRLLRKYASHFFRMIMGKNFRSFIK